jgi:hypothetical protein
MLGRKERDQLELLITGSLRQLIPETICSCASIVFSTFRGSGMKSPTCIASTMVGPASIPVAVRLMLAGLLSGIVHDRKLMREAHVNIAIRWLIGYGVHEKLPDHSSLTRIRQRWGADRFRQIFKRTLKAGLDRMHTVRRTPTIIIASSRMRLGTWQSC